jgi:hypothetical protein
MFALSARKALQIRYISTLVFQDVGAYGTQEAVQKYVDRAIHKYSANTIHMNGKTLDQLGAQQVTVMYVLSANPREIPQC